jgi:hypothetical protein
VGNSEAVAREHYLQTTDDHFRDAASVGQDKSSEKAAQKQAQNMPEGAGNSRNRNRKNARNPGNIAISGVSTGGGWESNPPGAFADATPGLKPVAVTRAAYTPNDSIIAAIRGECDSAHQAVW